MLHSGNWPHHLLLRELMLFKVDIGVPRWLNGKDLATNVEDKGSILGSGKSPGEGNVNPLQYSCLGNPMDSVAGTLQSMGVQRVNTTEWLNSTRACDNFLCHSLLCFDSIYWNIHYYLLKTSLKAKNFFLSHYHPQQLQHGHGWVSHTQSLQSLNSHLYLRCLFPQHLTLPTVLSLSPSLFYSQKSSCCSNLHHFVAYSWAPEYF